MQPSSGYPDVVELLITGASGRLGRELAPLLPHARTPARTELDVTDADAVERAVATLAHDARAHGADAVLLHAAAYTDVRAAEDEREACYAVNVTGTEHIARACDRHGVLLVHVSTDDVFGGDHDPLRVARGGYRETDPLGPARNHYAATKLWAEERARIARRHLVVRTSFRPREWPYETGFTDVRTSQTYVDEIAPELAAVVRHAPRLEALGVRTLHVAGPPTTVFELARRRRPDVRPASKVEAGVDLPDDVVLDCSRWHELRDGFERELLGRVN